MTIVETSVTNDKLMSIVRDHFDSVLDYLLVYHVGGFYVAADVILNNRPLHNDDFDKKLYEGDIVVIVHRPAVPAAAVGGSYVAAFLINMAISAAVSYTIGKIFAPAMPDDFAATKIGNRGRASSVYGLNSQQNEAKIGEVIPIIYGRVRTYPALIAPPYRRFENNEEYLYQLMCIGQGTYSIEKLMIGDTDVNNIINDNFKSRSLSYFDFSAVGGIESRISTEFGDNNYHQLVKTSGDIDNLELRGTPQKKEMYGSFSGDTLTLAPYQNNTFPDLTSLVNGSTVTITNSDFNDGVYTVLAADDTNKTIQFQATTFTTEPTVAVTTNPDVDRISGQLIREDFDAVLYLVVSVGQIYEIAVNGVSKGNFIVLSKESENDDGDMYYYITFDRAIDGSNHDSLTLTKNISMFEAVFDTAFGPYVLNDICPRLKYVEIDYIFNGGIYNTDASGNFIDRTVEFEVTIYYKEGEGTTSYQRTTQIVSTTAKDNSPIRKTLRFVPYDLFNMCTYFFQDVGHLYIELKRVTGEPANTNSYDKLHIRSIKYLLESPDNSDLGNITLLWCKIKASNAISSIGQFSVNAWVNRTDVDNGTRDVIADIYTNTDYGARLSSTDLNIPVSVGTINGAFDGKLTVMDAMKTAAKTNRMSVNLVGSQIELKRDDTSFVRSAFFNETNIIRDSLKISYNFTENNEYDSVKIKYRDSVDFKEAEAIYPLTGIFPEIMELWGCTDAALALSTATYLYKQDKSRRKTVEFKTDLQGLLPQFMDRIAVSHNVPNWGLASEVIAVNGSVVTVADSVEAGYNKAVFRNDDGSVSDILTFTGTGYDLTVTSLPAWVHGANSYEATKCSIGTSTELIQDFLVISVKPDGETVTIEGVNYDASVYS